MISAAWHYLAGLYRVALARPTVHRNELLCVQRMRGIAVLMVLVVHIEDAAQKLPGWESVHSAFAQRIGYSGPDMFFVISGFIMSYISFGMPFERRRWLVSRFVRIYPMYIFFTALVLGLWLVNPAMTMGSGEHDWGSALRSLLIVPQADLPLLFVGWTVEHEIVFYAIVFFTAWLLNLNWLVWVLSALSVLAVAKWAWVQSTGVDFWDFHLTSLYMLQFTMGALVYRFWKQGAALGWRGPLAACALLFVIGVWHAESGMINEEQLLRVLAFGGSYSLLLLGLLNIERAQRAAGQVPRRRDALVLLGDASYAVYLSHPFVLASFGKLYPHLQVSPAGQWMWIGVSAVVTFGVGWLVHLLMERPIIELGKRWTRPAAPVRTQEQGA